MVTLSGCSQVQLASHIVKQVIPTSTKSSSKGTFKWILKDQPKSLKATDIFRLGNIDFTVTMVDLDNAEIIIRN